MVEPTWVVPESMRTTQGSKLAVWAKQLRHNFITGLLALAPFGVCLWVLGLIWTLLVVPMGGWAVHGIGTLGPEVVWGKDGIAYVKTISTGIDPITHQEVTRENHREASFFERAYSSAFQTRSPAPRSIELTIDGRKSYVVLPTELLVGLGLEPAPEQSVVSLIVGFVMVLVLIILFGWLVRHVLGRLLVKRGEKLFERIPFIGSIYIGTKQLLATLVTNRDKKFHGTVLIPYPRPGIWALAFITNTTRNPMFDKIQADTISVFLPTTPNPTSGFLLLVPRADVIPLDLSVEEAIKYILSGGIVSPGMAVDRPPPASPSKPVGGSP